MGDKLERARELLREFKGGDYVFGLNCLDQLGRLVAGVGKRAAVVAGGFGADWAVPIHERMAASMSAAGVEMSGDLIPGAPPNAPRAEVLRIKNGIARQRPDVVVERHGGGVSPSDEDEG